jgi:hypothetical protein
VGEGNACALGVRRASQAALVLEAVRETTKKRTGRVAAATAATTTIYLLPKTFFVPPEIYLLRFEQPFQKGNS